MKVLLVSATFQEIEPFVEHLEKKVVQNDFHSGKFNAIDFNCLITGVGITATTFALTKFIQNKKYDLVINAGIAGSYNNNLNIGQVVTVVSDCFADFGVDNNGTFHTAFEEKFLAPDTFPFQNGCLVNPSNFSYIPVIPKVKGITVNTVTGSIERMQLLTKKFNPDIETMEGAAFAYICLMENIAFTQVRAISNKVEPRNKKNWNISLAIKNLTSTLIDIFTSQKFKI